MDQRGIEPRDDRIASAVRYPIDLAHVVVLIRGIEPLLPEYETGVLPLALYQHYVVLQPGIEPEPHPYQGRMLAIITIGALTVWCSVEELNLLPFRCQRNVLPVN